MKIKEHTKSLIIGAFILLILVAIGFIFSKVLVELWFCAFKFLVKKKMVNLAIIVLELPGMMFGGLVVFMTYEYKRVKRCKEVLEFLNENEKLECEIEKESVNSEQIQE